MEKNLEEPTMKASEMAVRKGWLKESQRGRRWASPTENMLGFHSVTLSKKENLIGLAFDSLMAGYLAMKKESNWVYTKAWRMENRWEKSSACETENRSGYPKALLIYSGELKASNLVHQKAYSMVNRLATNLASSLEPDLMMVLRMELSKQRVL
jgi:hypothetical protein